MQLAHAWPDHFTDNQAWECLEDHHSYISKEMFVPLMAAVTPLQWLHVM